MMSLCHWCMLAFAAMPSTVRCQSNGQVVSGYNIISSPKPFNITCDVRVVNKEGYFEKNVDSKIYIVYSPRYQASGYGSPSKTLWDYVPGVSSDLNFPKGRDWEPCLQEIYEQPKNIYHKSLRIRVRDASCMDVGSYACYVHVKFHAGFTIIGYAQNSVDFKGC